MIMRQYDLVIIGAGPGGYETALLAAGSCGMKTALVEKEALGGTCLNHGCIPTKTLLHSAELFRQMKKCGRFGLEAENVTFDMGRIQDRKAEVLETLRNGIAMLMKQKKVEVISGTGRILSDHTVEVKENTGGTRSLDTEYILIATGSAAFVPPIPGVGLPGVVTSDALLERRDPVKKLVIIGGGVIGMEFASVYSAFGSEVTVIEALPRIIANMDKELSQSLKMLMKKQGVNIITGARVEEIRSTFDGYLECHYTEKDKPSAVPADVILVCVGRRPCTAGLFGPDFKLETDRGRIVADENGQTSVPSVYAIGDVTGGMMLAHAAAAQGKRALARMNHRDCSVDLNVIPSCIYTEPEIACVGLTADQAKEHDIACESRKIVMSANGKTVLSGGERGFIKVVYDRQDHRILGAQMMCERASDMIGGFAQAVAAGLTMEQMASVIRPHPTFNEAVTDACTL